MVDFLITSDDSEYDTLNKQRVLLALSQLCNSNTDINQLKNYLLSSDKYTTFIETLESITQLPSTYHTYQHAIKYATTILMKLA